LPSQTLLTFRLVRSHQTIVCGHFDDALGLKLKLIKIVSRFDYRKGKSNTYEIIFDHVHDQKSQKQKYPSPDAMAEISIQIFHDLIKEKNGG